MKIISDENMSQTFILLGFPTIHTELSDKHNNFIKYNTRILLNTSKIRILKSFTPYFIY